MINTTFRVWIIDDRAENVAMLERSFPAEVQAAIEVRSFLRAGDALQAFESAFVDAPAELPDFVFLDYFLDGTYGHVVLERIRTTYRARGFAPVIVIANSSMADANALLLSRGADCAFEKIKGQNRSEAVWTAFRSIEAIRWFKRSRTPLVVLER